MNMLKSGAAAAAVALFAVPLHAQNVNANNLVSVTISDALIENVANDLNVEVSQVPVTVQVPIGIAANVCDVDANVLAEQAKGDDGASCEASNTSEAFNEAVQRQIQDS